MQQTIKSVFSNTDIIGEWLSTPVGYWLHDKSWGNPIAEYMFKNLQIADLERVIDKMTIDLGQEEAERVRSIAFVKDKNEEIAIMCDYGIDVWLQPEPKGETL